MVVSNMEPGCRIAPFNEIMIHFISQYQTLGYMPTYRCANSEHHIDSSDSDVLVATRKGLICPAKTCDYVQQWVHEFIFVEDNMQILLDEKLWLETVAESSATVSNHS